MPTVIFRMEDKHFHVTDMPIFVVSLVSKRVSFGRNSTKSILRSTVLHGKS
jgi:hypothetical protein